MKALLFILTCAISTVLSVPTAESEAGDCDISRLRIFEVVSNAGSAKARWTIGSVNSSPVLLAELGWDTQVSNGQQRFHANPFKGPNGNILAHNTNLIQLDKHDTQKLDIFGFTINGTPAGTPFIVKCQKCDYLANLAGSVCTVEVAYKSNGTGTGECLIFAGAPGVVVTQRCNSNDQLMQVDIYSVQ